MFKMLESSNRDQRKLSYLVKIEEVEPVINSDNLDVVSVRGWEVVTKRNEFKVGDICVYFEIDSVLPEVELFDFLKPRGYMVRTLKLRGQISQGLVISLRDIIKQFPELENVIRFKPLGYCLDTHIGVLHADKLEDGDNYFPSFLKKTKQERIQNIPLDYILGKQFEISIKLDGCSMTTYYNKGEFGICSRNKLLEQENPENNIYYNVTRQYNIEKLLRKYGKNLAIQGEVIGEKIQGNKEKIKGVDFYVFDVWDIDKSAYFSSKDRIEFVSYLGLKSVPLLYQEPIFISPDITKKDIISMADGKSLFSNTREGLVFKRTDGNFSFKAISNKFLLKC